MHSATMAHRHSNKSEALLKVMEFPGTRPMPHQIVEWNKSLEHVVHQRHLAP